MDQNLYLVLSKALKKASHSIHLVTYGLTDHNILSILEKKSRLPIEMKIFYDKNASSEITLSNNKAYCLALKGLAHQKILVTDLKRVFLGSVNYTTSSLTMHDNILVGFYDKDLSNFLSKKTPFYFGSFHKTIHNQNLDLFLLPDKEEKALNHLLKSIQKARKTIDIALFTLTHPKIINSLILAKNQGIKVRIFIDQRAFFGASLKAMTLLKEAKIPIFLNKKISLFHYKLALVDQKNLILGSANWTKAAFNKNSDYICFLSLNKSQKKYFQRLFKILNCECKEEVS